jgi:hypothetical protein
MKKRILLSLLILVTSMSLMLSLAQSKRSRATKELMRSKLELSQRVLEGLATEDYELIIAKGTRLSAMTKEGDWRLFENPDYDQQSLAFRRQVDALLRASKDKNLDAATLAYVRLTIGCVDCHKLIRGKLVAAADETGTLRRFVQEGATASQTLP